jgi:RNA polymerase sigma-70 factor (ECF subfamily)
MPQSCEIDAFESERPRLFALAYRMLGSVADAEDVVQDAFLRWRRAGPETVGNPRGFLSKVVSRLCLDRLKEARRRREIYVGPWLPEPLINDPSLAVSPSEDVAGDVSFALMLALERLSPLERAAFLLHDVFDMEFAEIAGVLGRSEAACRQLAARARGNVRSEKPRFATAPGKAEEISDAFFVALRSGDAGALRDVLAADAVFHADGGGRVPAARNIIRGAERIAKFFAGYARKGVTSKPRWTRRLTVNGLPGEIAMNADGVMQTTALEIRDGRVAAVYVTRNPDKLRHLAALAPQ